MKKARLLKDGTIVDAIDIYEGRVNRNEDFVDVEEDFRVRYWNGAKANGRPHFKIYLSREDYKRLTPEQQTRYDILADMRHWQESPWHREWEEAFQNFAESEKRIVNPNTGKWKYADVFVKDINLCIEFQHSYINYDFEERNDFYKELGIKTIWIYDLKSHITKEEDGQYKIVEDNAIGFFRIAENAENLMYANVFIQPKDKKLYLIRQLDRKVINNDKQSTIRFFVPVCILEPEEFMERIKNGDLSFLEEEKNSDNEYVPLIPILPIPYEEQNGDKKTNDLKSLYELWDPSYYLMIVYDTKRECYIKIQSSFRNPGQMHTDYENHIQYQFVNWYGNRWEKKTEKYNFLWWEEAEDNRWKLVKGYTRE